MLIAEGSDVNSKGCSDLGDLEVRNHIKEITQLIYMYLSFRKLEGEPPEYPNG